MTTPTPSPTPKSAPRVSISKAQILHLLAILVVTPLSGVISGLLAKTVLPHPSTPLVAAAMFAGAGWAVGLAIHYLRGWSWWERTVAPHVDLTEMRRHVAAIEGAVGRIEANQQALKQAKGR